MTTRRFLVTFFARLIMIMAISLEKILCQSSVSDVCAFPLGITDPHFNTAYILNGLDISAVDLSTGRILWVYTGGGWPIWRLNEMLLVLANTKMDSRFRIQLINVQNLGDTSISRPLRISQSDAMSLAEVDHAPFTQLSGDSLFLTWPRSSVYYGGANPPLNALHKSATLPWAGVKIDLHSLESEPVDVDTTKAKPSSSLSCNGSAETCEWTSSGTEMRLEVVKGRLVLKRVDSAAHHNVMSLGRISTIPPYITLDRDHVIISRSLLSGEVKADVYSVSQGRKIGRIPIRGSIHDAAAFGSTLFVLTRMQQSPNWSLTAFALPEGNRKWEISISRPPPPTEKSLPQ